MHLHNRAGTLASRIYNVDDTRIALDGRIVAKRGGRKCDIEQVAIKSDNSDSLCKCQWSVHSTICNLRRKTVKYGMEKR